MSFIQNVVTLGPDKFLKNLAVNTGVLPAAAVALKKLSGTGLANYIPALAQMAGIPPVILAPLMGVVRRVLGGGGGGGGGAIAHPTHALMTAMSDLDGFAAKLNAILQADLKAAALAAGPLEIGIIPGIAEGASGDSDSAHKQLKALQEQIALLDRMQNIRVKNIQEEYQRYMERVRSKAQGAIDQANTAYSQERNQLMGRCENLVNYLTTQQQAAGGSGSGGGDGVGGGKGGNASAAAAGATATTAAGGGDLGANNPMHTLSHTMASQLLAMHHAAAAAGGWSTAAPGAATAVAGGSGSGSGDVGAPSDVEKLEDLGDAKPGVLPPVVMEQQMVMLQAAMAQQAMAAAMQQQQQQQQQQGTDAGDALPTANGGLVAVAQPQPQPPPEQEQQQEQQEQQEQAGGGPMTTPATQMKEESMVASLLEDLDGDILPDIPSHPHPPPPTAPVSDPFASVHVPLATSSPRGSPHRPGSATAAESDAARVASLSGWMQGSPGKVPSPRGTPAGPTATATAAKTSPPEHRLPPPQS